jgi:TolB protein
VEEGTEVTSRQRVCIVDVQTRASRLLTQHPGIDFLTSWSPDSQNVLVNSYRDGNFNLYKVNIDTGESQRLTSRNFDLSWYVDLSWSPDSRWLAFRNDEWHRQIYMLDMQDYSVTLVADGYNYSPRWQPW